MRLILGKYTAKFILTILAFLVDGDEARIAARDPLVFLTNINPPYIPPIPQDSLYLPRS